MDVDEIWSAVDAQRVRIAGLLDTLTPQQWRHPSLCDGWTVRDVAAHLAMQPVTLMAGLRGFLRHPGSVNHVIHTTARDRAAARTGQLVAGIRATVGDRRTNPGLTSLHTLTETVIHGQDIAVPLGLELPVPPAAAAAAASGIWADQQDSRNRRRLRVFRGIPYEQYRFTATDTGWAVGDGPELRGPIMAILLVLAGRTAGLARLTGDGTDALSRHLEPLPR